MKAIWSWLLSVIITQLATVVRAVRGTGLFFKFPAIFLNGKCISKIETMPTYTFEQVRAHSTKSSGIWVAYQDGVYDITSYVRQHPGGVRSILGGSGDHLEMFWRYLPVHKNKRVLKILEQYRIGNLIEEDQVNSKVNPFSNEKSRNRLMEIISEEPYNANAYTEDLGKNFKTPNDIFYVRQHLPIPWLDIDEHKLEISGIGVHPTVTLSMVDIRKLFQKSFITVTLQCAGNRRSEMNKVKLTHGVAFNLTGISTATWGGVPLLDIINHFGINTQDKEFKFINFIGADNDLTDMHYGTSFPKNLALDPEAELFLAYEMNDEPLPRDHGYPMRLLAPGMAGFRSVKFLTKILFSKYPLSDVWENRMYKFFSAKYNWDNIDYHSAPGIYYTNVQSAILSPTNGQSIDTSANNCLTVMGYAYSGGGNTVQKIEVSTDRGESWVEASIVQEHERQSKRQWAWVFWQAKIQLNEKCLKKLYTLDLTCRAFDTSYNSQPHDVRTIWNMMGCLVNHWHTIQVKVLK